jgi:hypothetical protein
MTTQQRVRALGVLAAGLTCGVVGMEYAHVWRQGRAPLPAETDRVLEAGAEAARETVEVARAGYHASPVRENALLNLLLSYAITAGVVRASTHRIRSTGRFGPFRNARVRGRHIHHFIPGIALAFLSGGASIVVREEALDPLFAVPFGVGTALTIDEAALLVELEDVYWSEEGVLSVQATLSTIALLGALGLARRAFRRGEAELSAAGVFAPG